MKRIILFLAISQVTASASAQKLNENEVPKPVKEAFVKLYKDAKETRWEKEGANYEAEFEIGEIDHSVVLDANGSVIEVEVEISVSELPAAAKDHVLKNYGGAKIREAAKISDAKGTITYEAEIKGHELIFSDNGTFLKEIGTGRHE